MVVVYGDGMVGDEAPVCGVMVAIAGVVAGRNGFHLVDTGGPDRDPDSAVLLERPIEDVIIVAHSSYPTKYQFARGPALRFPGDEIEVPPCDSAGLPFEQAGDPFARLWDTMIIGEPVIEVVRIGGTIGAGLKRRSEFARSIFSSVHIGPEIPSRRRIHVGYENFRQMTFVHYRPGFAPLGYAAPRHHSSH